MHKGNYTICLISKEQLFALGDMLTPETGMLITRICLSSDLILYDKEALGYCLALAEKLPSTTWILFLPEVLRHEDESYLCEVAVFLREHSLFRGVMSGSLEGVAFFLEQKKQFLESGRALELYGDHSLYLWNAQSLCAWKDRLNGGCLPLELSGRECLSLIKQPFLWEKMVYGRIPMMVTANCVAKTAGICMRGKKEQLTNTVLKDRMGKVFPVRKVCRHCYNVIYNSIPLSLHGEMGKYPDAVLFRLQFTTESREETKTALSYYLTGAWKERRPFFGDYTTGGEKHGVQ